MSDCWKEWSQISAWLWFVCEVYLLRFQGRITQNTFLTVFVCKCARLHGVFAAFCFALKQQPFLTSHACEVLSLSLIFHFTSLLFNHFMCKHALDGCIWRYASSFCFDQHLAFFSLTLHLTCSCERLTRTFSNSLQSGSVCWLTLVNMSLQWKIVASVNSI